MIKETLFPEFERELRLDQLGDVLQKLEKNINFNKISQKLMLPHHDEPPQDVPISYRADGSCLFSPFSIYLISVMNSLSFNSDMAQTHLPIPIAKYKGLLIMSAIASPLL